MSESAPPAATSTLAPVPALRAGAALRCPKCGREQPAAAYRNYWRNPAYLAHTVEVYGCKACGHLFALREP